MRANKKQRGFTLVEIIIGIVVISISFSIITSFVLPATEQSANQVQQIKAAELGQSMLTEILGRSFDENSDRVGGVIRCNESGAASCTDSDDLGPDGESRNGFDDVDDFNGLSLSGENIENALGQSLGSYYLGFEVNVEVVYDGNFDGIEDTNQAAKKITVTVNTPSGTPISFAGYRTNF